MGLFAHKLHISGDAYDDLSYLKFLNYKNYLDKLIEEDRAAAAQLKR